jgi:hypothetical protein
MVFEKSAMVHVHLSNLLPSMWVALLSVREASGGDRAAGEHHQSSDALSALGPEPETGD